MSLRFFRRKGPRTNYLNRAVIGLGVGLVKSRNYLLHPEIDPQATMDVLATWMGHEIAKEMLAQKKITPQSGKNKVLEKLLDEARIAEDLTVTFKENKAHITVQKCLICPRRIGGYDLEGLTACPVGGMVRGALNLVTGRSPQITRIDLSTAEFCQFHLEII